jgi:general stress protein 26
MSSGPRLQEVPTVKALAKCALCASVVLSSLALAADPPVGPPKSPDRAAVIAAAREFMATQKYCALITLDETGRPTVRTMNPFPPDEDMSVWFATKDITRKLKQITRDPRVTVYYSDHQQASGYVAITGRAELINDMAVIKQRWREYWTTAFPDPKSIVLIKVVPERLDVLYYKKGMLGDSVTWRTPSVELQPVTPK